MAHFINGAIMSLLVWITLFLHKQSSGMHRIFSFGQSQILINRDMREPTMGIEKNKNLPKNPAELRNHAEAELRARPAQLPPLQTEAASKHLTHELEIHQIELEAQNAELLRSHRLFHL